MYTMNEQLSKRFNALRTIFIILVVYIHSAVLPLLSFDIQVPNYVLTLKRIMGNEVGIGTIAVPGFYFISAFLLFSKETSWIANIRKKTPRLILPFISINLFWILLFKLFQHIPLTSHLFMSEQYCVTTILDWFKALLSWEPMYYPFWFLWFLIAYNVLFPFFRFLIKKVPILFLIFILLIGFNIFQIPYFRLDNFVFFILGGYFSIYKVDINILDRIPTFLVFSLFTFFIIVELLYNIPYILIFEMISGLILAFRLSLYIYNCKCILTLSRYSFFIYCTHEFYEAIIKKIIMTVLPQYGIIQLLEFCLLPLFIILGCMVVGIIIDKRINISFLRYALGMPQK